MNSSKVKILALSDLHLNHLKISTTVLTDAIIRTVTRFNGDKLDYIVVSGDVFDRPTQMDTEAGKAIVKFISFMLDFVSINNIKLIVLKGTGSHDGNQSEHFVSMNNGRVKPAKLIYVDTIDAWVDEDNGLKFLGVPDEATPSAAQTQAEVESVLATRGFEKVDVAITHGMYNSHMINGLVDPHSHDAEYYNNIVNYIIINGHIHTPSVYNRLLTVGSFDRNRHGEEEAKGGWLLELDLDNATVSKEFVENKYSQNFTTYEVKGTGSKAIYKEIYKFITDSGIYQGGYLRIAHHKDTDVSEIIKRLKDDIGDAIEFSTKKLDDKTSKETLNERVEEFAQIDIVPITKHTVMELLVDKLNRMGIEDNTKYLKLFNTIAM